MINRPKTFFGVMVFFLIGLFLTVFGLWQITTILNGRGKTSAPIRPFNIVLIVLDAFRQDRLGGERNGVPLTPFLDSLKQESAFFPYAVTNCTWTRPAMASLFTSLYVDAHQVVYVKPVEGMSEGTDRLSAEFETLATLVKRYGYFTAAVQTNGNLIPEFGFARGFDNYRISLDADGSLVTQWAIEELNRLQEPFFLYVHYMDPHLPYEPPERYRAMMGYSPELLSEEERAIVENFRDYLFDHCQFMTGQIQEPKFSPLSETAQESVRVLYDALIRYTDDQASELVKAVRRASPDTLIVILADHGEHFWDQGFLGHGLTLSDCELRIPLFIVGGDIKPGIYERPVELVDIVPTIAALLGIPPSNAWQGANLFSGGNKPVYAKTNSLTPEWNTDLEMVITEGKKLVRDHKNARVQWGDWPGDTVVVDDTLTMAQSEMLEFMKQLLTNHRLINVRARKTINEQKTIDPEVLEHLRRLGYIH